ncbi:hypothetical protein A8B78_04360 [Jannaschia sp. EhC01]|nr:hypothetical protein A8B78_04360 [Jannaschia sp. EhC01]
MFQLLKNLTTGELFLRQLPLFAVSFGLAEVFYKFGSFALECVAFLATWFVLDGLVQLFWRKASAVDTVEEA